MAAKRRAGKGKVAGPSGSGRRKATPARRRRRTRPGTARRRLLLLFSIVAVAGSLLVSVDRTAEGRLMAEAINQYRTEEQLLLTRLSEELVRVDSLGSRERILVAAARFGLRPATDDEVLHLPDVGP